MGINLSEELHHSEHTDEDRTILLGQSASPGYYEGIARVILDPGVNAELQPGEILIAPYTDPAWTPLFLTAGAAVVEVGSYLSHAGTVAREYGLPCVVDVAECTKRIRSGDRLSVDGDQEIIHILEGLQAEKKRAGPKLKCLVNVAARDDTLTEEIFKIGKKHDTYRKNHRLSSWNGGGCPNCRRFL
ncbi:hypothetical protein KKHLCK_14355 [Candidatus Electrothrix laxa]